MSMKLCQSQMHIHIDSLTINDDSNNKALEILSNLHPTFGQKIFSSHLGMRIHKMQFSLARSDRFLVDDSQSSYILNYIQNISYIF